MKTISTILGVFAVLCTVSMPKAEARTLYNDYSHVASYQDEWNLYISPFRSATASLHPYWRNSDRLQRPQYPTIKREEFYSYLEDLYYEGQLGQGLRPYDLPRASNPNVACTNYARHRETAWSTPEYTGCQVTTAAPQYNRYNQNQYANPYSVSTFNYNARPMRQQYENRTYIQPATTGYRYY